MLARWLALILLAGACSSSDPQCEEPCGPSTPCPTGYQCRPGTVCNLCIRVPAVDAGAPD